MRRLIAAFALCGAAQPALALSCLEPDLARDFATAAAAEETYVIVDGTVTPDPGALPDPKAEPRAMTLPARIEGMALTREGFTQPVARDVTVAVTCAGPWCGGVPEGRFLAFLKQDGDGFVLTSAACPSMLYADPSEAQKATVIACARGDCPE